MSLSKEDLKEARDLPAVSGNNFSLLAEGFRDFLTAQMDDEDMVFEVLTEMMSWDRDDAKTIIAMLKKGVGHIYDSAEDPRARDYQKDKTVVRRKR